MGQAIFNSNYISKLILIQRKTIKWGNAIVALFSLIGAVGSPIWEYFPLFSCIIITLASIAKALLPSLFGDEEFLRKMDDVQCFYERFSQDLQRIWIRIENKSISLEKGERLFFKLKKREVKINSKVNDVLERPFFNRKKAERKSKEETIKYINKVYNHE